MNFQVGRFQLADDTATERANETSDRTEGRELLNETVDGF